MPEQEISFGRITIAVAEAEYTGGPDRVRITPIRERSSSPVRWLVIDAAAVTELDYSASQAVRELFEYLRNRGVVLALIVIQMRHHDALERFGLVDLLGADRIFQSRSACLEAYRSVEGNGECVPKGGLAPQ